MDLDQAQREVESKPESPPASSNSSNGMPRGSVVEADYIVEQQRQPGVQQEGAPPSEISRYNCKGAVHAAPSRA